MREARKLKVSLFKLEFDDINQSQAFVDIESLVVANTSQMVKQIEDAIEPKHFMSNLLTMWSSSHYAERLVSQIDDLAQEFANEN